MAVVVPARLRLRIEFGIAACEEFARKRRATGLSSKAWRRSRQRRSPDLGGRRTMLTEEQEASASLRPAVRLTLLPEGGLGALREGIGANSAHNWTSKPPSAGEKPIIYAETRAVGKPPAVNASLRCPHGSQTILSVGPRTSDRVSEPSRGMGSRTGRAMSALVHPHESVCTPVLAADAVMGRKNRPSGSYFCLVAAQPRCSAALERVLPVRLEVVGLPDRKRRGATVRGADRLRKAAALVGEEIPPYAYCYRAASGFDSGVRHGGVFHRVAEGEASPVFLPRRKLRSSPAISR